MRGEPANGATLCTIPAGVKKEAATMVGLGSQRVASVGAERRRRMEKEFFFCTWCGRERRGKKRQIDETARTVRRMLKGGREQRNDRSAEFKSPCPSTKKST